MQKLAKCPICDWSLKIDDSVILSFPCPKCGSLVMLLRGEQQVAVTASSQDYSRHEAFEAVAFDEPIDEPAKLRSTPLATRSAEPIPQKALLGLPVLASRRIRLFAALIDLAIHLTLAFGLLVLFKPLERPYSIVRFTAFWLSISMLPLVTQCYLLALRGQTVGKMMLRLRIANLENDDVPDFTRTVLIRYLFWIALSTSVPFAGLIDVLCILGPDRRCLHDRLAETRVIQLY